MPRTVKILAWATGVLIVVPVVLVTLVYALANVDWGRRLVERSTAQLSGGRVVLTGVSGHFPDDLNVAHVEIHDAGSPWLSAEDVTLQWSPSELAHKRLEVQVLRAGYVQLLRLPAVSSSREEGSASSELPLRVDIAQAGIDRLDIDARIAGAPASVTVQGHVHATSLQQAESTLTAKRLDAPGTYKFNGRIDPAYIKIEIDISEPSQGLLAGVAKLPDLGALSIQGSFEGPRNAEAMRLAVAAGALRASGVGKVDLVQQAMDLDLTAS